MSKGSLIDWKKECESIHKEMDHLFQVAWLETPAERQVRRMQYLALLERRDAAAYKLLNSKGERAD